MKLRHHDRYSYSAIETRPDFSWPNGRRLAFYIALNVEMFSFGEGLGHSPTDPGPPPDIRNYAWRDYGLRVGIWRIFQLMEDLQLPLCHLLNASVAEKIPEITDRIRQRSDEVIGHGYSNSEIQANMSENYEHYMIKKSTAILESTCNQRPHGWMGPWISETVSTPELLVEEGYTYIMDWPADDQPFWMSTRRGRLLSVPYPIEINDSPVMLTRRQSSTDFATMIIDQFEEMLRLSEYTPLVFGISLHTFVSGQPFRLKRLRAALQKLLDNPRFEKEVWITTPGGIAEYVRTLPEGTIL